MSVFITSLVLFIVLCLGGAVFAFVLPAEGSPNIVAWIGAIAAGVVIALGAITIYNPDAFTATLWSIPSVGPIVLRADPLSGLFLLLVGLVFLPTSIIATSALRPLTGRYNVRVYALFYFVLFISIVWILVAGDVFSFLIAWSSCPSFVTCWLTLSIRKRRAPKQVT